MTTQSTRSTLIRNPGRGNYQRDDIYSILDAAYLCHVGFVVDGEARVLPTVYVRIDNAIYVHGHLQNQMFNALLNGQWACVTVTLLDGLVLARSNFHHSANYRSVVVYGQASKVEGENKDTILNALVDHMIPNRTATLRANSAQELNATLVVKIPIDEASAKIRTGPPKDLESDYDADAWAGVVKLKSVIAGIEPCPRLRDDIAQPEHVTAFVRTNSL